MHKQGKYMYTLIWLSIFLLNLSLLSMEPSSSLNTKKSSSSITINAPSFQEAPSLMPRNDPQHNALKLHMNHPKMRYKLQHKAANKPATRSLSFYPSINSSWDNSEGCASCNNLKFSELLAHLYYAHPEIYARIYEQFRP